MLYYLEPPGSGHVEPCQGKTGMVMPLGLRNWRGRVGGRKRKREREEGGRRRGREGDKGRGRGRETEGGGGRVVGSPRSLVSNETGARGLFLNSF